MFQIQISKWRCSNFNPYYKHLHLFPQALLCGFSKPCRRACSETGRKNRFSGPKWFPAVQAPCSSVCPSTVLKRGAQARCSSTKIQFLIFNFEILSFQFSSFNFQFSKIRRFKSKFQNGDIQISIPTTNTCIYSHKLCLVGSQNPVGEHAVRQVGKIASPGRNARQGGGHRAQASVPTD